MTIDAPDDLISTAYEPVKAKLIAESDRIQSDLQQSHQAELQRAQSAQAMENYLRIQRAINAMYTNSMTFGNATNCMTH